MVDETESPHEIIRRLATRLYRVQGYLESIRGAYLGSQSAEQLRDSICEDIISIIHGQQDEIQISSKKK